MIEPSIIARIIATTALAFGITGSASIETPRMEQEARCPFNKRDVLDADVIRNVPASRARSIWI